MFLKTKVLDALSIASVVAILITLYSVAELEKTEIFPAIGFCAIVFVAVILLLHAIYFYKIRNKPTRGDTKLIKKMLSVVNVIGILALVASFMFITVAVAIDVFFIVLWILVIVGLNLTFTTTNY